MMLETIEFVQTKHLWVVFFSEGGFHEKWDALRHDGQSEKLDGGLMWERLQFPITHVIRTSAISF